VSQHIWRLSLSSVSKTRGQSSLNEAGSGDEGGGGDADFGKGAGEAAVGVVLQSQG
jgi:hypothetical protein